MASDSTAWSTVPGKPALFRLRPAAINQDTSLMKRALANTTVIAIFPPPTTTATTTTTTLPPPPAAAAASTTSTLARLFNPCVPAEASNPETDFPTFP